MSRDNALAELATELAKAQQWDRAEAFLQLIEEDLKKAHASPTRAIRRNTSVSQKMRLAMFALRLRAAHLASIHSTSRPFNCAFFSATSSAGRELSTPVTFKQFAARCNAKPPC